MNIKPLSFSNTQTKSVLVRSILFVFLLGNMFFAQAQEGAYYFLDQYGTDVLRVNTSTSEIEEVISFKDTVKVLNEQEYLHVEDRMKRILSPKIPRTLPILKQEKTKPLIVGNTIASYVNSTDSIQVNGTWHLINIISYDDGFIGGSPNQVDIKINVNSIGLIYSHSNFSDAHNLCMIYHENPVQQEILTEVHSYLAKNKGSDSRVNWAKLSIFSQQYSFENVINVLRYHRESHQNNLKIISQKSELIAGIIAHTTTIKNISNKRYCLLGSISPAELNVHYNDKTETINLVDGYHGSFLQGLEKPIYLDAGEEITLTQKLPRRTGTGYDLTYRGFKVADYRHNLLSWLLNGVKRFSDKEYIIYPLREIKS